MEEIHDSDNMRLVLGASYIQPHAQFSIIQLHIHRTNFVGPTLRHVKKDASFAINLPFLFFLQEETTRQTVSALISVVDSVYRPSVESVKGLICSFVRKVSYQSLDLSTGTLVITVRIFVTLFHGLPWQEAFDGDVLVFNEAPVRKKYGGVKRDEIGEICVICLEKFVRGIEIKKMICKHEFHGKCLDEWMLRNHSCPLCRFKL